MNFEITIPVLNEERKLEESISKTVHFLQTNNLTNFKIKIVDNGSTDNTKTIGEMLAQKFEVVNFTSITERGIGRALLHSWIKNESEIFGYMDLDLSTDLKYLIDVNEIFKSNLNVDVINGSRLLRESKVINRKINREIVSRVFNFLVKFNLKVNFTDAACGFKFFKRNQEITQILNETINREWFFPIEVLIRSNKKNLSIHEIPIIWKDDHDSKVKVISLSFNYFKEILRLKKEFK